MRISKNKILYSPTDLNNFVSCKYHIKNDLLAEEKKFKKREISADLKLRIKYGIEHETKHLKLFKNYPQTIYKQQNDKCKSILEQIYTCGHFPKIYIKVSKTNHLRGLGGPGVLQTDPACIFHAH